MSLEIVGMTQLTWIPDRQVDTAPKSKIHFSWSDRQDELMRTILTVYNRGDGIELDPMYCTGAIYQNLPEPRFKFDLNPQADDVVKCDARHLPFFDNSIASILLDPPFLTGNSKTGVMKEKYTKLPSVKALHELYVGLLEEAWRILAPKGLVVFKCQDVVSSGVVQWNHVDHVLLPAQQIGFHREHMMTLIRHHVMSQEHRGPQQNVRSADCKFIILRKGKLSLKEKRERAKAIR